MASKYASVLTKLPRYMGEEPEYQKKIDAVAEAMQDDPDFEPHAAALARSYVALRAEKDAANAVLSEINLRIAATEALLARQYEVEGASTIKLDTGESVSLQPEPYSIVEDRDKYREWCLAHGYASAMTLPWMTTNGVTKERLLNGEPEPDGIKCYVRDKFVLRTK